MGISEKCATVISLQEYRNRHLKSYFELALITKSNWNRKSEWLSHFEHTLVISCLEEYQKVLTKKLPHLVVVDSSLDWGCAESIVKDLKNQGMDTVVLISETKSKKFGLIAKRVYAAGAVDVFGPDFTMVEIERALTLLSSMKMMEG